LSPFIFFLLRSGPRSNAHKRRPSLAQGPNPLILFMDLHQLGALRCSMMLKIRRFQRFQGAGNWGSFFL
jgi:hypothetical protein